MKNNFDNRRCGIYWKRSCKASFCDVEDVTVIGIDNMIEYYDVWMKEARLKELSVYPSFLFLEAVLRISR